MTRRSFGIATIGAACSWADSVDQNPIRRRGVGFRAINEAQACPGFTLFAPIGSDGEVYPIDLRGKVVQKWRMPYRPGMYGYLTERATLFYKGKIPNESFLGKAPFKGGVALEAIGTVAFCGRCVKPITTMTAAKEWQRAFLMRYGVAGRYCKEDSGWTSEDRFTEEQIEKNSPRVARSIEQEQPTKGEHSSKRPEARTSTPAE